MHRPRKDGRLLRQDCEDHPNHDKRHCASSAMPAAHSKAFRNNLMAQARHRLAVDIGGTFTDLVLLDEETGRIRTLKVSSTPREPSEAVLNGVRRARDELEIELDRVVQFTHAST